MTTTHYPLLSYVPITLFFAANIDMLHVSFDIQLHPRVDKLKRKLFYYFFFGGGGSVAVHLSKRHCNFSYFLKAELCQKKKFDQAFIFLPKWAFQDQALEPEPRLVQSSMLFKTWMAWKKIPFWSKVWTERSSIWLQMTLRAIRKFNLKVSAFLSKCRFQSESEKKS